MRPIKIMKNYGLSFLVLGMLLFLLICCGSKDKGKIEIMGEKVTIENKFDIYEYDSNFLNYHKIQSLYMVDNQSSFDEKNFLKILKALLPEDQYNYLKEDSYYIQCYIKNKVLPKGVISSKNIVGFSLFTFEDDGINHYYFRKNKEDEFYNIEKLNLKFNELLTLKETLLLHFGSFSSTPENSGIVILRKNISKEQLKWVSKWPRNNDNKGKLLERIYGDPSLNFGVAYADDLPGGSSNCGIRAGCEFATGTSTCRADESGLNYSCVSLGEDDECWRNQVVALVSTDVASTINATNFTKFKLDFLKQNNYQKKYIGYYHLFSKYAKMQPNNISDYVEIIPELDRAVDLMMNDQLDDEIILTPELYTKVLEILNKHADISNEDFVLMREDVKNDINKTINFSEAQVLNYLSVNYNKLSY